MNTPQNKIALVTGTSSGIGLSTAVQLAQHGYTVVATMRDLRKARELEEQARQAGVSLDVRPLDVEDATSITACVQEVLQTYGHIDLLVNNAGAGFLGTMEQTSEKDLRRTLEINFFGVWHVTQAVFPAMRAAHSGRIITVTSVGGIVGQPFNDAYCAAKFAVEGMMEALAPVARHLGIDVSIIEPGPVNTNFVASVRAQLPEQTPEVKEAYSPMIESYMKGSQERFASLGQTPEQVAQIIVEVATAGQPQFRYATSELVRNLVAQKYADPSGDTMVTLFSSRLD